MALYRKVEKNLKSRYDAFFSTEKLIKKTKIMSCSNE